MVRPTGRTKAEVLTNRRWSRRAELDPPQAVDDAEPLATCRFLSKSKSDRHSQGHIHTGSHSTSS